MTWPSFLAEIQSSPEVTAVGPLHGRMHVPGGPTVYVDGGVRFRSAGNYPAVSVGDGDSATSALDELLPARKDYSDLAFVLSQLPASVCHLRLLGFLGGRRDHELLGFGEVHRFLKGRPGFARADFDQSVIAVTGGTLTMDVQRRFSLLAFEPVEIGLSGASEYPFSGTLPAVSTLGLSNEGHGEIRLATARPCFLIMD
jgi:hypothetical protein